MTLRLPLAFGVSSIIHVFVVTWLSAPLAGRLGLAPTGAPPAALQVRLTTPSVTSPSPPPDPIVVADKAPEPAPSGATLYWPTSLLDRPPEIIDDIPIDPPELRPHAEGGSLVLEVRIGIDGDVEGVAVIQADLPEVFVDSLTRHFRAARFRPGMRDGHPVRARMRVLLEVQSLEQEAESAVQIAR